MEQRLAGKKLKVWQGCLLVVLVAVFLFAAQFVLTFVQYALTYFRILPAQTAYTIASVAYWLFGGCLGLRFLRDYVLNYLYTANTKQLQVCRVYGPGRPRVMEDVYFSRLKAIGEVEAMKKRFPGAKVQRATLRRATLPVKAVAYDSAEGMKLLLFQPDGELCALLQAVLKDKK